MNSEKGEPEIQNQTLMFIQFADFKDVSINLCTAVKVKTRDHRARFI